MDDNIKNLQDAMDWLYRSIREEAELDGEMSNDHAIQLGFIQNMLEKFPRRNCDVGTVDEQTGRFVDFSCLTSHREVVRCATNWAQMPYESDVTKPVKSTAKPVEPPDETVVWVVYHANDGRGLITLKDKTWCGSVPFYAGPRLVGIDLYDDHTAVGDTGKNYIQPVAWFYTEEEAKEYIKQRKESEAPNA